MLNQVSYRPNNELINNINDFLLPCFNQNASFLVVLHCVSLNSIKHFSFRVQYDRFLSFFTSVFPLGLRNSIIRSYNPEENGNAEVTVLYFQLFSDV